VLSVSEEGLDIEADSSQHGAVTFSSSSSSGVKTDIAPQHAAAAAAFSHAVRPADDQLPLGCTRGQADKLLQQLYNEFAQGSPADGTGAAAMAVLKRCNNWSDGTVPNYWSYLHRIIAAALAAAGGLAPEHKQLCQQQQQ
jgi:hypothetical protein